MKRYHFVCLLFFLFFWLPLSFAIPVEKLTFNEPVIDQAQMLSNEERTDLNAKFWHYRRKNLMQAAVVLVDNTEGEGVFNYGMEIFDRWKLGDKDRDHGLLLLIARDEQRYHLFTGKGLEGVLPDITVKRILNKYLKPEFEKGDFAVGIARTFMAIENKLLTITDDEIRANIQYGIEKEQQSKNKEKEDNSIRRNLQHIFLPLFLFTAFLFTRFFRGIFSLFPKDAQQETMTFYVAFPFLLLLMGLYSLTDLPFFVCLVISLIIFNISYNRVRKNREMNPNDNDLYLITIIFLVVHGLMGIPFWNCVFVWALLFIYIWIPFIREKRNHRTKTEEDDDNAIIVFGHGRDDSNGFSFGRGDFGGFGGDGYDGGGGDSAGGGAGGGWGDSDGDSGGGDGGGGSD